MFNKHWNLASMVNETDQALEVMKGNDVNLVEILVIEPAISGYSVQQLMINQERTVSFKELARFAERELAMEFLTYFEEREIRERAE